MSDVDDPDIDEKEEEQKVLAKSVIKTGLSNIRRCEGGVFAFVNLDLRAKQIDTLEGDLKEYKQIRHINLSQNELTDVKPLQELPNIQSLDLRQNQLATFDAAASSTLQLLRLDGNFVVAMADKSFPSLLALTITKNNLTDLAGIYSSDRSASNYPKLEVLDLQSNQLTSVKGLAKLPSLKSVILKGNKITSLDGLEECQSLQSLDLSNNQLPGIAEVFKLAKCPKLVDLNISQNQGLLEEVITEEAEIRRKVLLKLPRLRTFNGEPVTEEWRIDADMLSKNLLQAEVEARKEKEREEAEARAEAEAEAAAAKEEAGEEDDEDLDE